ncbi:hypothetical protein [uncultured Metabacillus sp.]|uniref:hypothetical protein n=1 Tax=uncultured Metabacillus sp. TaxID=2860135 RepID=UPI00260EA799|nr:hypothetical protein [uncultured Metabacillus sp.]
MKKNSVKKNKIWKTLKTGFKILFILILLFLLISLINDLMNTNAALIEKVTQQGKHIDMLQGQLSELTQVNADYQIQLNLAETKIETLKEQIKISINNQPINQPVETVESVEPRVVTEEDLKAEIEPQLKLPNVPVLPVVLVGVLSLFKTLIPAY